MLYIEAINETQRRLRRTQTAGVRTTDYSTLVGDFVNLAKREVEDAWDWLELQTELTINTEIGQPDYRLLNFESRYHVKRVHNITDKAPIYPLSEAKGQSWSDFSPGTTGTPQYYRINGYYSIFRDPQISFWPTPSAVIEVSVHAKVCQLDLVNEVEVIKAPYQPILEGAYWRALDERGEDGGTTSAVARRNYQIALGDAISRDNANRFQGAATDWKIA